MVAPPAAYVDTAHRYRFTMPAVCHAQPAARNVPAYVACGDGYVRVVFAPGATDRPALQRVVNEIIGGWHDIKLLANAPAGKLGGQPARMIFAEGIEPGGMTSNIQMIAAVKDGGWYVVTFVLPAREWTANALPYFAPIKTSFRFMSGA